jgi:HK97 family phage major capsid protein
MKKQIFSMIYAFTEQKTKKREDKSMNKEMQKMLKEINDKKNEVKSLVADGKIDKAKAAKEELKALQEKFDLLFDLDEEEHEEIEDKVAAGTAKKITGEPKTEKKSLVKAFVSIVKAGFLHREPDEADVKIYKDALTSDATPNADGEAGIGVTIPEDIRTDIIALRRSEDNLEQYVNTEGVTTKSGSRNIEVDAESVPFDNVEEAAEFPNMDEPEFKLIKYEIKKKGGILKMTAELFEDTAANIMAYINKWIAKKTKATRNAVILNVLNTMTAGKEVVISNIDSLKDIFNEKLDPAIAATSIVITNQSGFNYLDKLKDSNGDYILQPDPTQTTKGKLLFGEYPIVKLSKKTLKSTSILADDQTTVTGYKHPLYCGDLKEAVTLFDRNVMTIEMNDKGSGLWEKDMTGIKVRDRFDVQPVDADAVIKGVVTEVVSG